MKIRTTWVVALVTVAGFSMAHGQRTDKSVPAGLETRVKQFFAQKKEQARALAKAEDRQQVPEIREFFTAGETGDWQTVARLYRELRRGAYQYEGTRKDARLETMAWQPINECYGAYSQCANMSEKYVVKFARESLDAMPRGSIYFGGTDPGRWLPTAFSTSHAKGDPCFVLTQNALADGLYLKYIRTMYGDRIAMPSEEDSKKAFQDYTADAQQRLQEGKLKPGEDVRMVDGKVQVSGQIAVMAINARIAKTIFDTNPRREFFVEESFPLEWMYPHLTPHGLIMKLNRASLATLPAEVIQKDDTYWTRLVNATLGKWLMSTTSVEVVCDFAQRVFERKESEPFQPDEEFVRNSSACKTYSKLRSSQAGVYAWRARNSASAAEKERMTKAADFAFRQAYALCPSSPEAVFRYVNLLVEQKRIADALLLAETSHRIDSRSTSLENLIAELERMKQASVSPP
jgi:hypothetical protein